jgi:NADH-quinone oxidoreductase subunit L
MNLVTLTLFLPLIGSLFSGLCIIYSLHRKAELVSTGLLMFSALSSIYLYLNIDSYSETIILYNWLSFSDINLNLSILFDPLTAVMFLVVTTVSAVVHMFSIGYMQSDPYRARFFSYLSLFTFAMLILVSADNFIQLFLGWEGVGLCSYLLVGFYYNKTSANNAAIKAFLVNRVGDFGYLIAIAIIYKYFNSLNFTDVFFKADEMKDVVISLFGIDFDLITIITMFLFMAAAGKSAQIGLHVWLPDAMEGPTPVSALIHAATMVTAGVFLIVRCSALFEYAEFTLNFITYVGLMTSLFAASVALLQDDIKKVIAYSTCSQLGYMFFACGISAYSLAMFHLVTHAFFKALLFLSAGSVIHALHHEQNCKNMGNLRLKLPFTYFFVILGSLALTGIPPFAGYFSKDLILEYAFSLHTLNGLNIYILGCLGAFLTAVYSTRLLYLTFHGKTSIEETSFNKIREAPVIMLLPLFILSIGAIFAGYLFYDLVSENNFWNNSIYFAKDISFVDEAHHIELIFKILPVLLVVGAIFLVFCSYKYIKNLSQICNKNLSNITTFLKNKWYFDELYNLIFVKKLTEMSMYLSSVIDIKVIDGRGPLGIANSFWKASYSFKKFQNGKIFSYAVIMFTGIIIFVSILFIKY